MISLRPARAAREVDLLSRQKARDSQSRSSTIPSQTVLTNQLPIIIGKSHQLSSRERGQKCLRTARKKMRALPDALPLLNYRVRSAGLAFRLVARVPRRRKKINVKRVNC